MVEWLDSERRIRDDGSEDAEDPMLGRVALDLVILGAVCPSPDFPGRVVVSAVIFGGALVLLALTGGAEKGLFRGDRIGVIALVLLAAWTVLVGIADQFGLLPGVPSAVPAFVTLGLALASAVQLGRAQHLPSGWRWAPAWSLGVYALAWIGSLMLINSAASQDPIMFWALGVCELAVAAVPIFLGVLVLLNAASETRLLHPAEGSE